MIGSRKKFHYEYWCAACEKNLSHPPCKIPVGRVAGAEEPFVAFAFEFYCYRCTWAMFHRFLGWSRRVRYGLKYIRETDLENL